MTNPRVDRVIDLKTGVVYGRYAQCKDDLWSKSSLSLSHTHTYTHISAGILLCMQGQMKEVLEYVCQLYGTAITSSQMNNYDQQDR